VSIFRQLQSQNWVVPVSIMCVILGFMTTMAWVTQDNRKSRRSYLQSDQSTRIRESEVDIEAFEQLQNRVQELLQQNAKLEKSLSGSSSEAKTLNESLQQIKQFSGLTELEGPGIVVTLRDSPKTSGMGLGAGAESGDVIHDTDVLRVVNELLSSGAEAVSVNDHRVTNRSSFRCVGPTILVNDIKIASPVEIRAIGDPKTLFGAMNLPGGILADIRQADPGMVEIERVEKMSIKAYTGSITGRFGKQPKATK
jgi:uncharacterized protein YlxW (UPF0749 family)